jgi:hypothetical protein
MEGGLGMWVADVEARVGAVAAGMEARVGWAEAESLKDEIVYFVAGGGL